LGRRPVPEPKAGQIQVKIHSTAVNPVDWKASEKIFDFGKFVTVFPTVLGTDAAGEVTKVAPDVTKFKVGDRIIYQGQYNCQGDISNGDKATFQQYGLADVDLAAKIPDTLNYGSASTIPVAAVTAVAALYDLSLGLTAPWARGGEGLYKGETLVVFGGSSSVGIYTIQLAALSGFRVITTASPTHTAYLQSLGASVVIDRSSPNLVKDIIDAAGGEVKYVVDAISLPDTQSQAVQALQSGGKLAVVLLADKVALASALQKKVEVVFAHGASHTYPEFNRGFWDAVPGYLERGILKPNRPRVLPGGLDAWEDAYALHRDGKVSGEKIVLRPHETAGSAQ
ncbi:GroES-like protein, partial [Obba rivulosa]